MKIRAGALFALVLASCPEPAKPTPPPPPPIETPPPPPPTPETKPAAKAEPAPGTRIVLAERKNNDSWDKLIVAGGRVWTLTNLNSWKTGPMYVPAARLWSVPVEGGALTKVMELEGLASLAADDASLFVAVNRDLSKSGPKTGRIFRLPLAGGAPVDLAKGTDASVVALDGDTLWFDAYKMPKDGSKPLSPSGVKDPLAFAFDDDAVYFTTNKGEAPKGPGKGGRVVRLPRKGGPPTVLARGLPDEPAGLAVDGTHVYVAAVSWATSESEKHGVVARVPKGGGDLETLATDQPALRHAWVSGDFVYVRSGRPGRPGAILRLPKKGGAVETVVEDSTLVQATLHDGSIYFSSDGTFRMEPFERLSPAVLVRFVAPR